MVAVENGKPRGVLTDRNIALALENTPDITDVQVSDLLEDDVVTGREEMSIFEAIDQMHDATIRRLPIVDEEGSLAGIVTLDDVLVILATELDSVSEILEAQSPRL